MERESQEKDFDRFTDPSQIKTLFQAKLPLFSEDVLRIKSCEIGHTWYKTYQKQSSYARSFLAICYHLRVTNLLSKKSGEQILYAKTYLENRSRDEFEKVRNNGFVSPHFGEAIAHLPKLDMIVWAFPNDPVLLHLPQCVNPEEVSKYFPYENLPSGLNRTEDIRKIDTEVIHYRPEIRCTTRYTLKWGKTSEPKEMLLFGKTFNDDQGGVLYERSLAFCQESRRDRDSFLVAQALGYNKAIKTLWQVGLKGKALVDLMDETNYVPLLQSVAKGLASFHQSRLTSPVRVSKFDQIIEIKKKIAKLIHAFPQFNLTLKSIEQGLEKDGKQLPTISDKIIHADFSVQQLLVCGNKVACFDFDEFAMGDPIQDIANFIVDCHFRSFKQSIIPSMISVFVQAYEKKVGFKISMDRLNWYIQMLFLTKAYRFYLQQRPQMENEIKKIISLAQKDILLGRAE